ncbi:TonB-dependent receptor [Bacterioplanes sanyensis]|uniref:TonB-dependent receptor plug domain-containing protein n=1 Tax=Bacterioplanes sanyensis TaxID=1249553 RepID=UPI0016745F83|nr:TonB-dependent receptor [Bacterioplanes sanyensis]GGY33448.1 TonB-dependent receptor [Bacterioplanes sanyensis]
MRKTLLSRAIILGSIGTASLAAVPMVSMAAETQSKEVIEEVIATGSRISTTVNDSPRPVTVLDGDAMAAAGLENVADALRNTPYNSLGSYREQSGSSFGGAALIDLRGLGADRTAVLINGRRVPGTPFTGSSAVDLNTIPMSAVERIEVLTDSASAVYGADAIGGVVNIIMKSDYNGTKVKYSREQGSHGDENTNAVKVTYGASDKDSSLVFSLDWQRKDPVYAANRDYSKSSFTNDKPAISSTSGISAGGNTGFNTEFTESFLVDDCSRDGFVIVKDAFGTSGDVCGYDYTSSAAITMGSERFSTFMNARQNIGETHTLFLENRISKMETFGRFAPAVGFFRIAEDAPLNDRGEAYDLFHRFTAHGPRDDSTTAIQFDTTVGIEGQIFDTGINYSVAAQQYNYDANEEGRTYIIKSEIERLVADGEYDFLNPSSEDNRDAVNKSAATLSRDLATDYYAFMVNFDGELDFGLSSNVGWAVGIETAREEYRDLYDTQREAQNIIGSAGNSASGDRDRWAAYGEMFLPITYEFDVTVAARFDDYSDFDSQLSPQIALRYSPFERLTLRASAGQGFKAPNLTDIYSKPAQSFENFKDTTRCAAQGISDDDCETAQYEVYQTGNPELEAETSTSINFGIFAEPVDNLMVSLDWYQVKVDDVIASLSEQDIMTLEQSGSLPAGIIVNRNPSENGVPGTLLRCVTGNPPECGLINAVANLNSQEVSGMDLRVQYSLDTNFGIFNPELQVAKLRTYTEETPFATLRRVGTATSSTGYPEFRASATMGYSYGAIDANWVYNYTDGVETSTGDKYDAWGMHTVNVVWNAMSNAKVSFGIRNVTDEDPSIAGDNWDASREIALSLYDTAGRTFLGSVEYEF